MEPTTDDDGNVDHKYQWTLRIENERFTMLNTDIEVAYDIDVDNFGDGTQCEIIVGTMEPDETACVCPSSLPDTASCAAAETFNLVQTYANVSTNVFVL